MTSNYWVNFWAEHGRNSSHSDPQSQVLRTAEQQPIDDERWQATLQSVHKEMKISSGHHMLDLCCGNGLFVRHFSEHSDRIVALDISPSLLEKLDELKLKGVETIEADMRLVSFPENSFDRILLYAAIQYLSTKEVLALFHSLVRWLKPHGLLYVGDIPDKQLLWNFYNTEARRATYFENLAQGKDIVGTWFEPIWLQHLGRFVGFSDVRIIYQPEYMIYNHYRFEAVLEK